MIHARWTAMLLKLSLLLPLWASTSISCAAPTTPTELLPRSVASQQPQLVHNSPTWLYRGDLRDPEQLKAAGGFLPRSRLPSKDTSFGLYNHGEAVGDAGGVRETIYSSTSASFATAGAYIKTDSLYTSSVGGWIYRIRPTPNMIDLEASLGPGSPFPHDKEFSAMGGILWEQVDGWIFVTVEKDLAPLPPVDAMDIDVTAAEEVFNSLSDRYITNKDYNLEFDRFKASGGRPELAGFFAAAGKFKNQEPWSRYNESTEYYAMRFMEENGESVGWHGSFPLFGQLDVSAGNVDKEPEPNKGDDGIGKGDDKQDGN